MCRRPFYSNYNLRRYSQPPPSCCCGVHGINHLRSRKYASLWLHNQRCRAHGWNIRALPPRQYSGNWPVSWNLHFRFLYIFAYHHARPHSGSRHAAKPSSGGLRRHPFHAKPLCIKRRNQDVGSHHAISVSKSVYPCARFTTFLQKRLRSIGNETQDTSNFIELQFQPSKTAANTERIVSQDGIFYRWKGWCEGIGSINWLS